MRGWNFQYSFQERPLQGGDIRQRLELEKELLVWISVGNIFQEEGKVIAKSLKQEGSWHIWGTARRLLWLEQNESGGWRVVKCEGLVGHWGQHCFPYAGWEATEDLEQQGVDVLSHTMATMLLCKGGSARAPFSPFSPIQAWRGRGSSRTRVEKHRGEAVNTLLTPLSLGSLLRLSQPEVGRKVLDAQMVRWDFWLMSERCSEKRYGTWNIG